MICPAEGVYALYVTKDEKGENTETLERVVFWLEINADRPEHQVIACVRKPGSCGAIQASLLPGFVALLFEDEIETDE